MASSRDRFFHVQPVRRMKHGIVLDPREVGFLVHDRAEKHKCRVSIGRREDLTHQPLF